MTEEKRLRLAELDELTKSRWCPVEALLEHADLLAEQAADQRTAAEQRTKEQSTKSASSRAKKDNPDPVFDWEGRDAARGKRVITFREMIHAFEIFQEEINASWNAKIASIVKDIKMIMSDDSRELNKLMVDENAFIRAELKRLQDKLITQVRTPMMPSNKRWKSQRRTRQMQ